MHITQASYCYKMPAFVVQVSFSHKSLQVLHEIKFQGNERKKKHSHSWTLFFSLYPHFTQKFHWNQYKDAILPAFYHTKIMNRSKSKYFVFENFW